MTNSFKRSIYEAYITEGVDVLLTEEEAMELEGFVKKIDRPLLSWNHQFDYYTLTPAGILYLSSIV